MTLYVPPSTQLELFLDIYTAAYGELNFPFVQRRLSFRADAKMYYPQLHESVLKDEIEYVIAGNTEKTIFLCLSKAMRNHRRKQKKLYQKEMHRFENDIDNLPSITIRYVDSLIVPESFTLGQILSKIDDEKVEGVLRGIFVGYPNKPTDKTDKSKDEKERGVGLASSFADIDCACKEVRYNYAEWEKHYNDLSSRYTIFLRPTIICTESHINDYCSHPDGARIIPVKNPLFDASPLRIAGDQVKCSGLIQIISESDLKLAEKSTKDYLLYYFKEALQNMSGLFGNSHYEFGNSLVLEGILLKDDD